MAIPLILPIFKIITGCQLFLIELIRISNSHTLKNDLTLKSKNYPLKDFEMIAKTLYGFEEILENELRGLGAKKIEKLTRAVRFFGDKELLYSCNLNLRTAIKILVPIDTSTAYDEGRLYRNIKRIEWETLFSINETFAIDGVTSGDVFTHSQYVALKSKDAIADRFREKTGERPSVDTDNPDIRINVHIQDRKCTVSLDSSGDSLGKRGYKTSQVAAPLSEVLAAGLIKMTGWKGDTDFIDPMCGSGTIAIEAALMAKRIAPGSFRTFLFENWVNFDPDLWEKVKQEAKAKERPFDGKIIGMDKDGQAVNIARDNARTAGVNDITAIRHQDFLESEGHGNEVLILMNPPYGERLEQDEDMNKFYGEIGTHLKHKYEGNDAWIFSANSEALKHVGLRPSKKIKLYNGPLEARFHKYELYRGSKKGK